jgi:heme/copper-type cytochrome/quinol oxidase subunit 3
VNSALDPHRTRHPRDARTGLAVARGALLATSSAALAITAHAVADGGPPNTALILLLTVLIGWVSTALAERTRGPGGILVVLGCAQLLMHLALSELVVDHGAHAASGYDATAMTAAHVVATVLTALILARAESALLAAAASVRLLVPVRWRPPPVPTAAPLPTVALPQGGTLVVAVLVPKVLGLRGPPIHS